MAHEAEASIMEAAGLAGQRSPDDTLAVRFSIEPVENPEKSKEAGRPIFDDTEIIEIRVPGDPDIRRHAVSAEDRARFARHYQAWKTNQNQDTVSGTPLSVWPLVKRSQAEEAKFFSVHTVEQLAEMPDIYLQRLGPGWPTLRTQARDWLAKARDGALLGKLRQELEERDRRITALEEMLKRQATELRRPVGQPLAEAGAATVNPDLETLKMQVATLLAKQATPIEPPLKQKRHRRTKAEMQVAREAAKNGKA